jgi:hypothetical protein
MTRIGAIRFAITESYKTGKRLSGSSAIRLEAHFDVSTLGWRSSEQKCSPPVRDSVGRK